MSVQYDIPIKNTSGETMPPFSVGEIQEVTAFDKDLAAEVKQPSDDSTGCVVVGPQVKVRDGKPGLGSLSFGVRVAFDDNGGEDTPAVGETWGGKDGSWKIHKDGTIGEFKILGDIQGGLVRVSPLGGGGGGGPAVVASQAIAICVKDVPASTVPNLSGPVENWVWAPGQAGPPADRRASWGPSGDTPTRWTSKTGVVLVDWARDYDTSDLASYFEASYKPEFDQLAPIIECFSENASYVGGGFGGSSGEQSGGATGGGGGGI